MRGLLLKSRRLSSPSISRKPRPSPGLVQVILICLLIRLLLDTSYQVFSPFLPILAQGMGLSIVALASLVSLRTAMGIIAPLFGALADRIGYRPVLLLSLFLSGLALILMGAASSLWVVAIGMIVLGIGTVGFGPALMAYLSDRLPSSRRARGLGVVEYSWALSSLIGVSLTGLLIEQWGWRVPFFVLGIGLMIGCVVLGSWDFTAGAHPATSRPSTTVPESSLERLRSTFSLGSDNRSTWSTVLLMGLVGFSGMHVSIMYGTWLHAEYSLGAARLGIVALIIGVADLSGSVLVSLVGDRLGRRTTLLLGIVGSLAAYSLLPFLNRGLVASVVGIAAFRFCFEVSTVGCAPLLSELATRQRGKAFAVGLLSGLAGYSVAGLTGPAAYASHGVSGLGVVSATTSVVSLMVLLFMIKMPSQSKRDEGLVLTPESGTPR